MARKPLTRWQKASAWLRSPGGQRLTHMSPALMVGVVGFYASYQHIYAVSVHYGQPRDIAALMPVAIDALMIVAGRYVTHARSTLGKFYAVVGFLLSSAASLGANILAAPPEVFARVVAGWPAVCLIVAALIVHYGERRPRRRAPAAATRRTPSSPAAAPVSPPVDQWRAETLTDVPLPWDTVSR